MHKAKWMSWAWWLLQCRRLMRNKERKKEKNHLALFLVRRIARRITKIYLHAETVLKHLSFNMSWSGGTHTLRLFNMLFAVPSFWSYKPFNGCEQLMKNIFFPFFWLPSYGSMSWVLNGKFIFVFARLSHTMRNGVQWCIWVYETMITFIWFSSFSRWFDIEWPQSYFTIIIIIWENCNRHRSTHFTSECATCFNSLTIAIFFTATCDWNYRESWM